MRIVAVGSTNPVKIAAVRRACRGVLRAVTFQGVSVKSGVAEQPITDRETRKGAFSRAQAALNATPGAIIGVGLEGGVRITKKHVWSLVWCCVYDKSGRSFCVSGGHFQLPPVIAARIRAGGELGPIMDRLVGEKDVKRKQGMIGVLTRGVVNRARLYADICRVAVGLWHGRDWDHV